MRLSGPQLPKYNPWSREPLEPQERTQASKDYKMSLSNSKLSNLRIPYKYIHVYIHWALPVEKTRGKASAGPCKGFFSNFLRHDFDALWMTLWRPSNDPSGDPSGNLMEDAVEAQWIFTFDKDSITVLWSSYRVPGVL
jgi:hypothetical protein